MGLQLRYNLQEEIDILNPIPVEGILLDFFLLAKWTVTLDLEVRISSGVKFPLNFPISGAKIVSPSNMRTTSWLSKYRDVTR